LYSDYKSKSFNKRTTAAKISINKDDIDLLS